MKKLAILTLASATFCMAATTCFEISQGWIDAVGTCTKKNELRANNGRVTNIYFECEHGTAQIETFTGNLTLQYKNSSTTDILEFGISSLHCYSRVIDEYSVVSNFKTMSSTDVDSEFAWKYFKLNIQK